MLRLREAGLLNLDVLTVTGEKLSTVLDWWQDSERRSAPRDRPAAAERVEPEQVIFGIDGAKAAGLTSTVVFPIGNIAPEGSVVKATAIDPAAIDPDGVYRKRGPARVFVSERAAIAAIKGQAERPIKANDVVVLIGAGPLGTGMEETYQLTSALKYLPWGHTVAVVTDARFSGVSTGACIGHVGPEALAGGAIGKLVDGDVIEIEIDRNTLEGRVELVEAAGVRLEPASAAALLAARPVHPELAPHPELPDDTRLWAALQRASGGTWAGCVYDVERIIAVLEAGLSALEKPREP